MPAPRARGARHNPPTMDRRLLICAAACWPAVRLRAQDEEGRPHYRISAAQLFEALSARFPLRFGVAGLLQLEVSAPRLLLLPARNKLGASLIATASGPALQPVRPGDLDVVFGVRYEAADRTLRAYQPEILALHQPDLAPDIMQALQAMLPTLSREIAGELVLHRFTPRELALPDTMGFEPRTVTVMDDGLLVTFAQKPR
jgi:hypothetical protein